MIDETALEEQLCDAIRAVSSIRDQMTSLLSSEDYDDLRNRYYGTCLKEVREQIRRQWKTIIAPVHEELQFKLAKAERERDELIRRAARRLP